MTAYLTVDDVLAVHEHVTGDQLLRDFGLLESAVLRPQSTVSGEDAYPTVLEKAGALFHSIARNHAFVDGNKRTAVVATLLFLDINGYVDVADDLDLVAVAVDVAEGLLDPAATTGILKGLVVKASDPDDADDATW